MKENLATFMVNAVLALSGWASLLYERTTYKPRIRGKVFNIMRGHVQRGPVEFTSFFTFLHLTNSRRNAVTILDFQMEAQFGGVWHKLTRPYDFRVNMANFTDNQGQPIPFTDQQMIFGKGSSLEFGRPLQGWIMFLGDPTFFRQDATKYRVTCRDELDGVHVFETAPEQFEDLGLLIELTGLRVTPALATGPAPKTSSGSKFAP
jgi:hypothetical protein